MVHLITNQNRPQFQNQLASMHRDRKRVFVDRLKWKVPVIDDLYEVDQFDTDYAVYLIDIDGQREHLGSMRLLPTTRPHLLGSIFPYLCQNGVPVGEDIWEVTRLCTRPGLKSGEPRRIRQRVITAMVEFGLLYGITRFTCVAEMPWISQIIGMGWRCDPLGLPQEVDGEMIGALQINISPEVLKIFRQHPGCSAPVLMTGYMAEAA